MGQSQFMEVFLEILKYVAPSVVMGLVVYLVLNKMIEQENRRNFAAIKKENLKHSTPARLQAYERVLLLLERIDPVSVVNRIIKPGMTAKELQYGIVSSIREEFEHNVTQQLYISADCWEEVLQAKEDAIKLVTLVSNNVAPNEAAIDFSKEMIKVQAEKNLYTSKRAIQVLKSEVFKIF